MSNVLTALKAQQEEVRQDQGELIKGLLIPISFPHPDGDGDITLQLQIGPEALESVNALEATIREISSVFKIKAWKPKSNGFQGNQNRFNNRGGSNRW